MEQVKHTKIGNVNIGNGVFLAPMEDVCDSPFRIICKELGADIVYSEFIASEGIVRNSLKSKQKMQIADEERPTAIQIFGADFDSMVESAKVIEDAGADILDINFGCWVQKVVRREAGAAFLKQPEKMAEMTREVVEAVNIPVTVKTRLGWSKSDIVIEKVAKMIEDAGAKALAIHCRTRDMGMSGEADWSWIPVIKDIISIPVILNGDVKTPEDCKRAMTEFRADAVMIGRACIGYPFIFQQAKEYMETGSYKADPGIKERIRVCLKHLEMSLKYKGPKAVIEFRKHYSGYLKGYHDASAVRKKVMETNDFETLSMILNDYVKFLEDTDHLEPVSKTKELPVLRANDEAYVAKKIAVP